MTCEHKEGRTVKVTAKTIEIRCKARGCRELLHTRTRVLSSNIFAVARVGKNTEIQFLNGDTKGPGEVAVYFNVPKHLHESLMASKSKGKYFHQNIKDDFEWEYLKEKEDEEEEEVEDGG